MKHILLLLAIFLTLMCQSQQTYRIQFDGEGKLRLSIPEKLFTDDELGFIVNDPKENFNTYIKTLNDKLNKSKGLLEKLKLDNEKMGMLTTLFNISSTDIDAVIGDINLVLANPMVPRTFAPSFTSSNKRYYNVNIQNAATSFSTDFAPNVLSDYYATIAGNTENQLEFTLVKSDPFKKLAFDWLQQTKADYPAALSFSGLQQYRNQITNKTNEVGNYFNSIQPFLNRSPGYNTGDINQMDAIITKCAGFISDIQTLITTNAARLQLNGYKTWMLKWMWYQNQLMPAINPLPFRLDAEMGPEPDTSALTMLKVKIAAREDFIKNIELKKLRVSQIDSLISEADSIKRLMYHIKAASDSYHQAKTGNRKADSAFRTTGHLMNKAMLFVGKKEGQTISSIYWMRHHDASNAYQLMSDLYSDEYLEKDRVLILSHNLKPNEKTEISLTFREITNDASLFADALSPVLNQLANAAIKTGVAAAAATLVPTAVERKRIAMNGKIAQLHGEISNLNDISKLLDYLLVQSNPAIEVEERVEKSVGYHSQIVNPAKKIYGPKKATYYMHTATAGDTSRKNIVADTFTYRINKLYRFFPMAGLNYTVSNFTTINVDSSGKGSKVSNEPHARFVLGLKAYIKKTDIRNNKLFTKKDNHGNPLWPSRLSVSLAFDLKKPLDNFFIGPGLDIWPGVCFNVGVAMNKYTHQQYSDEKFARSKDLYRAGFYVGISTDLSLFTDIGKFLNLTK